MRQALLYYLKLLVVPWGSTCRCSNISHACSRMLWHWLPVLLPNRAGCQDVRCPRRFEWGQVIDPVVEGGNLAQLVNVFRPDDEAIPSVEIFPNRLGDIACDHRFRRSDTVLAIDDVELAVRHLLEVFRLVVQLWHDAERLLLRPVRHVHEVCLEVLHASLLERSDCPCIRRVHEPHDIQLCLLPWVIEDKGVLALGEEFLEDDIDVVVVNHLPMTSGLRKLGHHRCQAGGQLLLG